MIGFSIMMWFSSALLIFFSIASDVFLAAKASALYLYSCGSATIGE